MTRVAAIAEILTVGLPFCIFKLLTGAIALDTAAAPLGYALIALGAIDAVLNLVNLASIIAANRRIGGVCLADLAARRLGGGDLGLAIDVFLSFALVAAVVGGSLFARMPAGTLVWWNWAVVANVLGAGIGRLFAALRERAP
ncbi:MAG TPA: hypothetical protein VGM88_33050 [Kofleriaceae bacterium]